METIFLFVRGLIYLKMKNSVYIVHRQLGRIRIFVPGLYKCKETAETVNRLLAQVEGVYYIHANPLTARVLVTFDEKKCSLEKIVHLIVYSKHESGTLEVASTGEMTVFKPVEDKDLHSRRVIEPEDLPIKRQLFNVALGGGVLALLTLKRFTLGKSRFASSQRLFNLAAATTLVSSYPVLRSGIQQLARGRINHDLIMSAISLITVLLRESIPGLLVIWLVNLTALLQTLVRAMAQQAIKEAGANLNEPHLDIDESNVLEAKHISWNEQALHYGDKIVPLSAGLAGLTGFASSDFSRSLTMLLAATPAPARLGTSTAQTAALTAAVSQGIMVKDPVMMEKMAWANCLLLPASVLKTEIQVGHVIIGIIGSRERVTTENTFALKKLKSLGIIEIIPVEDKLSGDERLNLVLKLKSEGKIVAYAGREKADQLALSATDLSLAYVRSDPRVIHRAGVILTQENPLQIVEFRQLAFKAEENFHRNLSIVRGLNLLGLGLGATGRLSMVGSTLFNNLISIIVSLNSLAFGLSARKKSWKYRVSKNKASGYAKNQ